MMIKKIALLSSLSILILNSSMLNAMPKVSSAKEIQAQEEKQYAAELALMKKRSATNEAKAAIDLGFPYLLAHHAGRSTVLVIPGLNQQQQTTAQQRCPILIMDGMGDTIYGNQHMAYRKATLEHAASFNKMTYKACISR